MEVNAELSETTRCLCLASRRVARAITRQFDRELRAHGLKATQFTLLAVLTLEGPTAVGALAEILGADRTTVTRNLAVVEHQGFVRIETGPDARSRIASVTTKGRQTLAKAFVSWRRVQASLIATIGPQTVDSLNMLSVGPPFRN